MIMHWRFLEQLALAVPLCLVAAVVALPADDMGKVPGIYETDPDGMETRVSEDKLYTFEKDVRNLLRRKDAPNEIIVVATSPPLELDMNLRSDPDVIREILMVSIYGDRAELKWVDGYGRNRHELKLSTKQIESIRRFVSDSGADKLPPLNAVRVVRGREETCINGTAHVYLHLTSTAGRRVYINNPPRPEDGYPRDEPIWKYTKIVDFFNGLKPATASAGK
jgi:hypothetical protein